MTSTLVSDQLTVVIDPGRGADVLSVRHRETDMELLFSTPWRDRANALRDGTAFATSAEPVANWMEHYRGGWQTLLPNAGAPREHGTAVFGYHGEASTAPWTVLRQTPVRVDLSLDLFTIPLSVQREVALEGDTLSMVDLVTNVSGSPQEFDYVSHPAFGGDFLATDECVIDTSARSFIAHDSFAGTSSDEGQREPWPFAGGQIGASLHIIPGPSVHQATFGTLADFDEAWATVTNPRLGLRARLSWDASILPFAWFWQELNSSLDFPWFARARVMAIEPASRTTSGTPRRLLLAAGQSMTIPLTLVVTREPIAGC